MRDDECRSISWAVTFEVCIDGNEARFDDLTESEQEQILDAIRDDSYSGLI